MRYIFRVTGWVLWILPWIAGCAGPASSVSSTAAPPKIQAGPVYELLKFKTSTDKVCVVVDDSGRAHVFIVSGKLKSVTYVLVDPQGVVQRQVIQSSVSPYAIDAAFDKEGTLHLLIDDRHFIGLNEQWQPQPHTPWQEAGFKAGLCRFVPGGPDLIWAFNVKGSDVGVHGRWDWYGFGGYGGGLIWPWPSQASKLAVVPQTSPSCSRWYMFDMDSHKDTDNWKATANLSGTVYAIYDTLSSILTTVAEPRYAQFSIETAAADNADAPEDSRHLEAIRGKPLEGPFDRYGLGSQCSIAADPNSDYALFVKAHSVSWLIREGTCSKAVLLPIRTFWEPRLAPAGGQRFHAAVIGTPRNQWTGKGFPVLYLEFSEGKWSAPAEVGLADISSMLGGIWQAVQIGGRGPDALVTWPTEEGIFGRWIHLNQ